MRSDIPPYGALGYHWKGRSWFVNLYIWRRGPWRLSWRVRGQLGAIETPMRQSLLRRALTDVLWGMGQKKSH